MKDVSIAKRELKMFKIEYIGKERFYLTRNNFFILKRGDRGICIGRLYSLGSMKIKWDGYDYKKDIINVNEDEIIRIYIEDILEDKLFEI